MPQVIKTNSVYKVVFLYKVGTIKCCETFFLSQLPQQSSAKAVSIQREMVMKPGKVLCCTFFLAILGVDPAQNLAKYKRWLCVLIQLTKSSIAIM